MSNDRYVEPDAKYVVPFLVNGRFIHQQRPTQSLQAPPPTPTPPTPTPPPPDPVQQALLSAIVKAIPQPGAVGDIPPDDGYYATPSDGINGAMDYSDDTAPKSPTGNTSDTASGWVSINPIISPTNTSTNVNTNISYDKDLAGDHKSVLNVLFTGLITGSAAMVFGESPLYYGSLGALSAAMTVLRPKELSSMIAGQLPASLEKKLTPEEALMLIGGVAISGITGHSIFDSALILGAGAFLGPVL